MTYPLIGNYGVNSEDQESRATWVEGFVVREVSRTPSNWRLQENLDSYLKEHNVIAIEGVDTRALTKHIRTAGAMKAIISTVDLDPRSLVRKAQASPDLIGRNLVTEVTCKEPYRLPPNDGPLVAVLDCGVKHSILHQLHHAGCYVIVVPAHTSIDEIISLKPEGILLSNGPGDPAAVPYAIDTVHTLLDIGSIPIFGICLGHQLLGLALGGTTLKLKFGHHGANHPVKDLRTGKIDITVQNHGFCVDVESLNKDEVTVTHTNLNDSTLEGMIHRKLPLFSVQFHPEAGPGPHDARYLFSHFLDMIRKNRTLRV
jgi:carbamoyl-phosphate synthase small subunit